MYNTDLPEEHFHLECFLKLKKGLMHTGPACSQEKLKLSEMISLLQYWKHNVLQTVFLFIFYKRDRATFLSTCNISLLFVVTECLFVFPTEKRWILLTTISMWKFTPKQMMGTSFLRLSSVLTKHAVISHKMHCCFIRDFICEWLNDDICSCFVMLNFHH